jgi:hypothetical protein
VQSVFEWRVVVEQVFCWVGVTGEGEGEWQNERSRFPFLIGSLVHVQVRLLRLQQALRGVISHAQVKGGQRNPAATLLYLGLGIAGLEVWCVSKADRSPAAQYEVEVEGD